MALYMMIDGESVRIPREVHGKGAEAIQQYVEHKVRAKRPEPEEEVNDAE